MEATCQYDQLGQRADYPPLAQSRSVEADAPAEYSDETWSRQVGSVTPQHVGRLRRVYERFGQVYDGYDDGLYWSHFQAALDWNDAEMWLEGAVQNDWSISEMRRTRWETLGGAAELQPREEDIVPPGLGRRRRFPRRRRGL